MAPASSRTTTRLPEAARLERTEGHPSWAGRQRGRVHQGLALRARIPILPPAAEYLLRV